MATPNNLVRARSFWVSAFLLVAMVPLMSCGSDAEDTTSFENSSGAELEPLFDAPSKDEINDLAGFAIPEETEEFRAVVISEGELNVQFKMRSDEVKAFSSGSGLELESGNRVIIHASPIWELNVEGEYLGGESNLDSILRRVEVIDDGTPEVTVRLSLSVPIAAEPS